ncbi:hypothetical protein [Escherichia coli]|uniref:hypothetical protein n=1 Tax=Escherichia coli TaxID=562 RepID=UPI003CC82D32
MKNRQKKYARYHQYDFQVQPKDQKRKEEPKHFEKSYNLLISSMRMFPFVPPGKKHL